MKEKQYKIERRIKDVVDMIEYTNRELERMKAINKALNYTDNKEVLKRRRPLYDIRKSYRIELNELVEELFKLEPIEE